MNTPALPTWLTGEAATAPRYTSYPPAPHFNERFGEGEYRAAAARSNDSGRPLSLYVHIPFCRSLCYYCACNKIVTKKPGTARTYLDYLQKELSLVAPLFDKSRPVTQLHWGGGTPTYLSDAEMTELMYLLSRHFNLGRGDAVEYSIEVDPRTVDEAGIALLRGLGFNRISFGVQDFNHDVQKAIHRVQSTEQTTRIVQAARAYGFKSISVDLIYGLPLQSAASFAETLTAVIALGPDRLSLFHYAHLPDRFFPQSRINTVDLPSHEEKLKILALSQQMLADAGYEEIGMDHYARKDDGLAKAQQDGELQRNFQGYSTNKAADLIGLGVSSIGQVDNTYSQNYKAIRPYYEALDEGRIPVERGFVLNADDLLRRDVIMGLLCNLNLSIRDIEHQHGIVFADYFAAELHELQSLPTDWIQLSTDRVRVLEDGKPYIRFICRLFDHYWKENPLHNQRYSRVI